MRKSYFWKPVTQFTLIKKEGKTIISMFVNINLSTCTLFLVVRLKFMALNRPPFRLKARKKPLLSLVL